MSIEKLHIYIKNQIKQRGVFYIPFAVCFCMLLFSVFFFHADKEELLQCLDSFLVATLVVIPLSIVMFKVGKEKLKKDHYAVLNYIGLHIYFIVLFIMQFFNTDKPGSYISLLVFCLTAIFWEIVIGIKYKAL